MLKLSVDAPVITRAELEAQIESNALGTRYEYRITGTGEDSIEYDLYEDLDYNHYVAVPSESDSVSASDSDSEVDVSTEPALIAIVEDGTMCGESCIYETNAPKDVVRKIHQDYLKSPDKLNFSWYDEIEKAGFHAEYVDAIYAYGNYAWVEQNYPDAEMYII